MMARIIIANHCTFSALQGIGLYVKPSNTNVFEPDRSTFGRPVRAPSGHKKGATAAPSKFAGLHYVQPFTVTAQSIGEKIAAPG